jgi:putative monooxygenase
MARLVLPSNETLVVEPTMGQEVFIFIEAGALGEYAAGSVLRVREAMELEAHDETALIAAVVEASASSGAGASSGQAMGVSVVTVDDTLVFLNAGGKLRVQIFHDSESGAANGAFGLLDADADLSVPEHVHEESVEVLYIVSGDGTLILGEERTPVAPGDILYIPMNTNHGYEAGTQTLRAFQVYAPPGPEQRFRQPPPE